MFKYVCQVVVEVGRKKEGEGMHLIGSRVDVAEPRVVKVCHGRFLYPASFRDNRPLSKVPKVPEYRNCTEVPVPKFSRPIPPRSARSARSTRKSNGAEHVHRCAK